MCGGFPAGAENDEMEKIEMEKIEMEKIEMEKIEMENDRIHMNIKVPEKHNPEAYYRIKMWNDYYEVVIRYLDFDYPEAFANHTIDPGKICIVPKPLEKDLMNLEILPASDVVSRQYVGVKLEFARGDNFLAQSDMETFRHRLDIADGTLSEVVRGIHQYFPGVLK